MNSNFSIKKYFIYLRENNDIIFVMRNNKVTFLKEKSIKKRAEKNFDDMLKSGYAQNPIAAKLIAFQKTKKEINPKDLLE